MLKHVETIGNYSIAQELDDDRFYYIVMHKGMDVDMFTSLEKAQEFITEILQKGV